MRKGKTGDMRRGNRKESRDRRQKEKERKDSSDDNIIPLQDQIQEAYDKYIRHYWHVYALLIGQLLSYPFYVLSVHVLYYPFSKSTSSLGKKSHDMFKALDYILKT